MNKININTAVTYAGPLPKAVDVVIIGAGIIGISTALHLAEAGKQVLVCEKGRVAGEQSSRNWGWVRQQGRDPAELPIMIEAMDIWKKWSDKFGEDLGFKQCGVIYLANTEVQSAAHAKWVKLAAEHGVHSSLLNRQQIAEHNGNHRFDWRSGLITPGDARAEPWQAVPVLARAAAVAGAKLIENCAVRSIAQSKQSITGVHTEQGTVQCEQVLLCGGVWSSLFLKNLGINLPQLSVRATVACTESCEAPIESNISDSRIAVRKRQDGGYTLAITDQLVHPFDRDTLRQAKSYLPVIKQHWTKLRPSIQIKTGYPGSWQGKRKWTQGEASPFEQNRVLEPEPDQHMLKKMRRRLAERYPDIAKASVKHTWAGMIDAMPDVVPVVDQAPSISGLWIATGMSGHGFGVGPAMGRIVADLLQARPAGHDLDRFRFSRFSDGSPIRPGPMI